VYEYSWVAKVVNEGRGEPLNRVELQN